MRVWKKRFTDVYLLDLRGDAKLQGEDRKKTGGIVFGQGSKEPICVTILVKNPNKSKHTVHYKQVDDYQTLKEKMETLNNYKSVYEIKFDEWNIIEPNNYHDWVGIRVPKTDEKFNSHMELGDKKSNNTLFHEFSSGIKTHRDALGL